MHFPDISPDYADSAEKERQKLLRQLGLTHLGRNKGSVWLSFKEGNESKILKSLLKIGCANIYRLSRVTEDVGQYSTVLRALRRLERKRLVQVTATIDEQRKQKKYRLTLFGELAASLVKRGWKLAAEKLAARSSRFRESITAHNSFDPTFDPDYYVRLTREIIVYLYDFAKYKNAEPNVEELVTMAESEWIFRVIIENFNDPKERARVFKEIEKLSRVDWIRPIVISFVDDYIGEEKEWLDELVHFREAIVSAQKNVKLSQFR